MFKTIACVCVLALAALTGCWAADVVNPETPDNDVGTTNDTGIVPVNDAGTDAGTNPADGGTVIDAGTDAGNPADGGVENDAGTDAGQPIDGGTTDDVGNDAGTTDDTGTADAGQTDAGSDAGTPDAGISDVGNQTDAGTPDAGCTPDCASKNCGESDGCGHQCVGICFQGYVCNQGTFTCDCAPDCTNQECGDNNCGESCGTCLAGEEICNLAKQCVVPVCNKQVSYDVDRTKVDEHTECSSYDELGLPIENIKKAQIEAGYYSIDAVFGTCAVANNCPITLCIVDGVSFPPCVLPDGGFGCAWDGKCAPPPVTDGGTTDAGNDAGTDAGVSDAGMPDAGIPDTGTADAGSDAGTSDAGTPDAGTADAGSDAGTPDAGHQFGSSIKVNVVGKWRLGFDDVGGDYCNHNLCERDEQVSTAPKTFSDPAAHASWSWLYPWGTPLTSANVDCYNHDGVKCASPTILHKDEGYVAICAHDCAP